MVNDQIKRYGCDPQEFLNEIEASPTVRYAVCRASGLLSAASVLVSDAQRQMATGEEYQALQMMERAKLLISETITAVDLAELVRRCPDCGATMQLYCRCTGKSPA